MGFLEEKCTFRVLTADLIKSCSFFDCGHPDLNDFFQNDCIDYSKQLLGKSYCFTFDDDSDKIVCAFTVSNDSIKTSQLPNNRRKKVNENIPHQKHFNSYPAVLIGRLGVNIEFKNKGIGKELMNFIKSWFIDPNNKTGCRFIVVDSYNEEIPLSYYKKNDFNFIFSSEEQEKESTKYPKDYTLKTRLLYFDLILLSGSRIK